MEINRTEILRYLGTPSAAADDDLNALIASCSAELRAIARPRHLYKIYEPEDYPELRKGRDITRHLLAAERWVLMAATLGSQVDRQIDIYQVGDLTRSLVLNACATAAIEAVCTDMEATISADKAAHDLTLGPRFSPGYGDFPLNVQPALLDALNAGKGIGLSCTSSFTLVPKKSVTALAPLRARDWVPVASRCQGCALSANCPYQERAKTGDEA